MESSHEVRLSGLLSFAIWSILHTCTRRKSTRGKSRPQKKPFRHRKRARKIRRSDFFFKFERGTCPRVPRLMDVQNSVLASHLRRNGEQTAFEMSIRSEVVRTDRTNDTELRSSRFRIRWKALTKLGFRDFLFLRYGGFYIRAHAARAPAVNLGRKKPV